MIYIYTYVCLCGSFAPDQVPQDFGGKQTSPSVTCMVCADWLIRQHCQLGWYQITSTHQGDTGRCGHDIFEYVLFHLANLNFYKNKQVHVSLAWVKNGALAYGIK